MNDIVVRIAQFDTVVTRSKDLKAHLIGKKKIDIRTTNSRQPKAVSNQLPIFLQPS